MPEDSQHMKQKLLDELQQMHVFWSHPAENIATITDEQLIEKVLIHSELDDIYTLLNVYPKSQVRQVWENRLVPDNRLYSLNKLIASLFFDIAEPGKYIDSKLQSLSKL